MFGRSSDDVLLLPRRIYGWCQNSPRIKKTAFFGKSTFWVSTFLPLLSAELWTHVGVRKQYSTIASPNQSVSNESSFASHSICDEKILRRTLKGKRKRHEDLFAPQSNWASFSLHRGTKFILSNAHLQFRRSEYAVLDFSMQMSPFHELGFGKKKRNLTKESG